MEETKTERQEGRGENEEEDKIQGEESIQGCGRTTNDRKQGKIIDNVLI